MAEDNIKSTSTEEKLEQQFHQTQEAGQVQQQQKVNLDAQTFFAIKLQEFDKMIAEAEENVASLKKQKAAYVYDTNVQQILQQQQQQSQATTTAPTTQSPAEGQA